LDVSLEELSEWSHLITCQTLYPFIRDES